jgi:hypothetical protein
MTIVFEIQSTRLVIERSTVQSCLAADIFFGFTDRQSDEPKYRAQRLLRDEERVPMTGQELKQLREDLGDALGRPLTAADMAKLCGLAPATGANMIRRWEVTGPAKPVAAQLRVLAMASDRHPILENFNVFDRFDIAEGERPARREAFREQMRDEVRRRLG